ncbi:MAG: hypothetical protein ACLFN1_06910 [Bacteroidales bacterium]
MKSRRLISISVIISLSLLMASCYSEYLSLDYKIMHGATWNDDHSKIASFITKKAYRRPEGIARFPDGGISKTLYSEAGLYIFEPESKKIHQALAFEDLPSESIRLAYTDSLVYYAFSIDWEYRLYFAKTEEDTLKEYRLKEKYARPFVFNERTGEVSNVDTSVFLNVYEKDNEVDYMTLARQISEVPPSELGLVLRDIYPKPDREYIDDFIYSSDGGSHLTKRAIAEQVISRLDKDEIRDIIERIDRHKNSLEGYERKSFERNSEDKYELLKELL